MIVLSIIFLKDFYLFSHKKLLTDVPKLEEKKLCKNNGKNGSFKEDKF